MSLIKQDRLPESGGIEAEVVPPRPAHLIKEDASGNTIELDPLFGIPIQRQSIPANQNNLNSLPDESSYVQTNVYKPQVTLRLSKPKPYQ